MTEHANLNISARTRLLAVLGHPVGHSLSPAIHNAALQARGFDAVYLAFDVEPHMLREAIEGLRAVNFLGANLTIPHKEHGLELVDALDPLAARVGAINTIVNDQGCLWGHNTDIAGFAASLELLRPSGALGARCVVAGAGGAARAVVAALCAGGATQIWLTNRSARRAHELCEAARAWGTAECEVISPDALATVVPEADVIVNATSVGLGTLVKESAIPVDILHSRHVVVDLVYGPHPTYLVEQAVARGAVAIDGREMLVRQAARSFELWTGLSAPVEVMRSGLEAAGR
jgi:shikimate dehydrogenase